IGVPHVALASVLLQSIIALFPSEFLLSCLITLTHGVQSMMIQSLSRLALAGALFFTAGAVMAQHDMGGGGTTSGSAVSTGSSSRSTTTVRRPPPRRTTPRTTTTPVRRGITAEQYNALGDEAFKAQQYDDALEAYQKAVAMKPIASAYYHIGWIQNDREDFDEALVSLQQAVTLNPNIEIAYNELGYTYRNLKRYPEAVA